MNIKLQDLKQIFDYIKIMYQTLNGDTAKINTVFEAMDNIVFITSLSLKDLFDDKLEIKNVIVSSVLCLDFSLSLGDIRDRLSFEAYYDDLYIITVSWLKTVSLSNDIEEEVLKYKNILGTELKIIHIKMSYVSFFLNIKSLLEYRSDLEKNDKSYLGINPIIFFRGLSWGTIVQLFKLININLHGGSISRRHKLSMIECRLGYFMYLTKIFTYDKNSYFSFYSDNYFTSSKYADKYLKNININVDSAVQNDYIVHYLIINKYINISSQKFEIEQKISLINKEIVNSQDSIKNLNSNINNNNIEINSLKISISSLKNKLNADQFRSIKNKSSLSGRIKKYSSEIDKLYFKIKEYSNSINDLKKQIISKQKLLSKYKENESNILLEFNDVKSKLNLLNVFDVSTVNSSKYNNKNIGGKREYHSLIHNRSYSTDNSIRKLSFSLDSPIFMELSRILNNSILDEDTQVKIEQFLNNQGVLLLSNRIDQTLDINYYKLNPIILDYLKKSISDLDKLINNYKFNIQNIIKKDNAEYVESMIILALSNDEIISQLLGRLLRIISNNNLFNKNTNCTELACDLGQSLLYSFYSKNYKNMLSNDSQNINYRLSEFVADNYKELSELAYDSILIQIGLKLLNFLEEVKLIHSEIYVLDKNHKNHIFVANNDILNSIGKFIKLYNISYKIPMIVKPNKYYRDLNTGKDILGGFLLNDKEYLIPLIIKNSELKDQSKIENENIIFDLVNNLSSVSYKINIPVLEFILEKGLDYDLFIDPNFKHPLEIKKEKENKLTLIEKKTLDGFLSRKQLESNILGLALLFKNVPEFFIPVRIDNRGRVYCMVDYLHYQGIELSKALLLFSKGERIYKYDKNSIDYLKIFGANCFGNGIDKKSYNDRINWVDINEMDILNFKNGVLLNKAESKLLFIAFCFEYINYYNSLSTDNSYYISYFPIQLDATCNGYQHLSLLTGDEPLAGQLNLIPVDDSDNSIPKDFYNFVALKLNDYIKSKMIEVQNIKSIKLKNKSDQESLKDQDLINIDKTINSCERLIKLNKNRKLVKLPIMVKPYNATLYQMVNYVKEQFEFVNIKDISDKDLFLDNNDIFNKGFYRDKMDHNIKLTNSDLFLLINTIEKIIYNEFPKLKNFNSYLNEVAKICSKLNISITWTLPSGLNVIQYYVDSEAIRLKPFKFKKNTYSLKIKTNKLNKAKQIRALMPNLIHSLDAASLSLIVDLFFNYQNSNSKGLNFFAIHDCFAVTANNIVNLIKFIKLVYIKIYSDDIYLRNFDQGIINSIKLQFGEESFNDESKIIQVNGLTFYYPNVDTIISGSIKSRDINKAKYIIN